MLILLCFSIWGTFPLSIQSLLYTLLRLLLDFTPPRNLQTSSIQKCRMAPRRPLICHVQTFGGNLGRGAWRSHRFGRAKSTQTPSTFDFSHAKIGPQTWLGSVVVAPRTYHCSSFWSCCLGATVLVMRQVGSFLLNIHLFLQIVTQQRTFLLADHVGTARLLMFQPCTRWVGFVLRKRTPSAIMSQSACFSSSPHTHTHTTTDLLLLLSHRSRHIVSVGGCSRWVGRSLRFKHRTFLDDSRGGFSTLMWGSVLVVLLAIYATSCTCWRATFQISLRPLYYLLNIYGPLRLALILASWSIQSPSFALVQSLLDDSERGFGHFGALMASWAAV